MGTRGSRQGPWMDKVRKKIQEKKARHLQLIEEVKQEMIETYVNPKHPKIQPEDRQTPIISYAGPAMTIRLNHDIKLELKY